MSKYPIHHKPSDAFAERVRKACSLNWELSGLEIVQHGPKLFSAHFTLRHYISRHPQKVELGPKPSLAEIMDRTIEFITA